MEVSRALSEYWLAYAAPGLQVLVLPQGTLPADQGAGLGVAGRTALSLVEKTNLKPGMCALISGTGGGIGTVAFQLTRQAVGRRVIVIGIMLIRSCGADNEA